MNDSLMEDLIGKPKKIDSKENKKLDSLDQTIECQVKKRKEVEGLLNESIFSIPLVIIKTIGILMVIGLFGFSILESIVVSDSFYDIKNNIDLVEKTFTRAIIIMRSFYEAREIYLTKKGFITSFYNTNFELISEEEYLDMFYFFLEAQRSELMKIEQEISERTILLHSSTYDFYLTDRNIMLYYNFQNNSIHFIPASIHEGVLNYISAINEFIREREIFTGNSTHFDFIMRNGLGTFLDYAFNASFFYSSDFQNRTTSSDKRIEIWLIFGILALAGFAYLLIIGLVYVIEVQNEEILKLFLSIPAKYLRMLKDSSDLFLQTLNCDELNEISENDIEKEIGIHFKKFYRYKRNKAYTHSKSFFKKGAFGLFFFLLIVCFYYLFNHFSFTSIREDFKIFMGGFEDYLKLIPLLYFQTNFNREYFLDADFEYNEMSMIDLNPIMQNNILKHSHFLEESEQWQAPVVSDEYMEQIRSIYYDNICEKYELISNISECNSVYEGNSNSGLSLLISYFMGLGISALNHHYCLSQHFADTDYILKRIFSYAPQIDMYHVLEKIINPLHKKMTELTLQGISENYESRLLRRSIMLYGFLLVVTMSFLIVWRAHISSITEYCKNTKRLLAIAPVELIHHVQVLKDYLERIMLSIS